jgi:hypothetical protein
MHLAIKKGRQYVTEGQYRALAQIDAEVGGVKEEFQELIARLKREKPTLKKQVVRLWQTGLIRAVGYANMNDYLKTVPPLKSPGQSALLVDSCIPWYPLLLATLAPITSLESDAWRGVLKSPGPFRTVIGWLEWKVEDDKPLRVLGGTVTEGDPYLFIQHRGAHPRFIVGREDMEGSVLIGRYLQ